MDSEYREILKRPIEYRVIEKRSKALDSLVSSDKLNPLISVQCSPLSWCERKRCFLNVEEQVRRQHGKMITGWMFGEYRDKFIVGEAHAIWLSPFGKKIDVTPHDDRPERILFTEDPIVEKKRLYTFPKPQFMLSKDPKLAAIEAFSRAIDKMHSEAFTGFGNPIFSKYDDLCDAARVCGLPQEVADFLIQKKIAHAAEIESRYGEKG